MRKGPGGEFMKFIPLEITLHPLIKIPLAYGPHRNQIIVMHFDAKICPPPRTFNLTPPSPPLGVGKLKTEADKGGGAIGAVPPPLGLSGGGIAPP